MQNLSLNELKPIAKSSPIKGYNSMFKERLLSALEESESVESEKNYDNARMKNIKKDFNESRDNFLKLKKKEIRRNLFEIENKNNISTQAIKEIEENLHELEKRLSKLKKYYDYDDIEYKGIKDVGNSFDLPNDKDYYSDEIRTMHTKSHKIEIMMGSEPDDNIKEPFESLLQKYQEGLEEKIRGSEFVFDSVDLLHYNLHKISFNRRGSYIDSPEWLKNEKATINPKNNDDKCFQYALTAALNHRNIKKDPQRISKIKPFIDQYNWKEIRFPSHQKDWERFE